MGIIQSCKICQLFLSGLLLASCQNNEIKVEFEGIEDKAQIRLRTIDTTRVIYQNAKQTNDLPEVYGENDWLIVYKDSLCGKIRHFKTNTNDKHTYQFRFFKNGGKVFCEILIKGETHIEKILKLNDCRLFKP